MKGQGNSAVFQTFNGVYRAVDANSFSAVHLVGANFISFKLHDQFTCVNSCRRSVLSASWRCRRLRGRRGSSCWFSLDAQSLIGKIDLVWRDAGDGLQILPGELLADFHAFGIAALLAF